MRQGQFGHATMVSPAPGFTGRVMARIEARERSRARRRAAVGAGLLVIVAGGVVLLTGGVIVSMLAVAITNPDMFLPLISIVAPVVEFAMALVDALVVAGRAIAENISMVQMLVYAVSVFALAMLWVHMVTGSQGRLLTLTVGGTRK